MTRALPITHRALTIMSGAVLAAALTACAGGGQEVSFPDPTMSAETNTTAPTEVSQDQGDDVVDDAATPTVPDDGDVIDLTTPVQSPTPEPQRTLTESDLAAADDPINNDVLYPGVYDAQHPWNQLTPTLDQLWDVIEEGQRPPAGYIAIPNGPEFYLDTPPDTALPASGTITLVVGQVAYADLSSRAYDTITISNNGVITGGKGRAYHGPTVFKLDPNAPLAIRALRPGTATVNTDGGSVTVRVEPASRAGE